MKQDTWNQFESFDDSSAGIALIGEKERLSGHTLYKLVKVLKGLAKEKKITYIKDTDKTSSRVKALIM